MTLEIDRESKLFFLNFGGIADPRDDFSCEIPSNSNNSRAVHSLNQQSQFLHSALAGGF